MLTELKVTDFLDKVAGSDPAPGGGRARNSDEKGPPAIKPEDIFTNRLLIW